MFTCCKKDGFRTTSAEAYRAHLQTKHPEVYQKLFGQPVRRTNRRYSWR